MITTTAFGGRNRDSTENPRDTEEDVVLSRHTEKEEQGRPPKKKHQIEDERVECDEQVTGSS